MVNAPNETKEQFKEYIQKKKEEDSKKTILVTTAGSSPPAPIIEGLENMGFGVTHVYGIHSNCV